MDRKEANSDTNSSGKNVLAIKRASPEPSAEALDEGPEATAGRWTNSEHLIFIEGMAPERSGT